MIQSSMQLGRLQSQQQMYRTIFEADEEMTNECSTDDNSPSGEPRRIINGREYRLNEILDKIRQEELFRYSKQEL